MSGDWRSQVSQRAVEACAVLEQARAGLVSQRDTVLDAVVAVIVPNADAAVLQAAADLLVCPALQPGRLLALVEPRRAQLSAAFAGVDGSGELDESVLHVIRAGLMAARAAIIADLERHLDRHPDRHLDATHGMASAVSAPADSNASARDVVVDDVRFALEGALRQVASELASNARLLRRRAEAEAGLRTLDDSVITDARATAADVLRGLLSRSDGAWRFDDDIAPRVLLVDDSALGVLRATRSLSTAVRIIDVLRSDVVEPLLQVLPGDVAAEHLLQRCERCCGLARAAALHRGWGDITEADSVWDVVFAVASAAFDGVGEAADRRGLFLSLVQREGQRDATGRLDQVWGAANASDGDGDVLAGSTSSSPDPWAEQASRLVLQPSTRASLPERLGRYALLRRLGGGGMGEVFLARQDGPRGFAKHVVVKCIRSTHADDAGFISLFQREARVVARLNHHNVISVLDVGVVGGRWFMAVEYLDGRPAHALMRIAERAPLPMSVVARVILDAAHGLAHAHDNDVVHRDVSPDNIMVTASGGSKVIDFGVASVASEQDDGDALMGKLAYMAPELLAGTPVSPACDVWALGVTFFQLITGQRPFDGGSDLATVRRITTEQFDVGRLRIESALRTLVTTMLDKNPQQRPTAHDVTVALVPWAASVADVADWLAIHPLDDGTPHDDV